MTEGDAQAIWLVHAVESEDRDTALLTAQDRAQATEAARREVGERPGEAGFRAFVAARARFAAERLAARQPIVADARRRLAWPRWIGWAIPLAAFAIGLATNELDNGRRLNLIAFPLLGSLVWNIIVYAGLAARAAWPRRDRTVDARPGRIVGWWRRGVERTLVRTGTLGRALSRFTADWMRVVAPVHGRRVERALHLGAAALVAGLLASMYGRALGTEYRAGWESTFLDAGAVHALLSTLLAPASALTGIAVPGLDGIAALRWTGPALLSGGAPAGPWIHLLAVTAALVVIAPRLALAGLSTLGAWRAARRLPLPGLETMAMRRLARDHGGGVGGVRIIPYGYRPDAAQIARWRVLIGEALGADIRVTVDASVDYGAEDDWLAAMVVHPDDQHLVALFNLAATPEAENHGAFITGLARRANGDHPPARSGWSGRRRAGAEPARGVATVSVIVDATAFRARLDGTPGAATRIASRADAWRAMLATVGVTPVILDSAEPADVAAPAIEAALVGAADLAVGAGA